MNILECLQVQGCPPVEPFSFWTIMDREEQPTERSSRERHPAEDEIFRKWLKDQKSAKTLPSQKWSFHYRVKR
jgi:hypothetical protein